MTRLHRLNAALGGLGRPVAALVVICGTLTPLALWGLRLPEELATGLAAAYVVLVVGVFAGLAAVALALVGGVGARLRRRSAQVTPGLSHTFGGARTLPPPRSRARPGRNRLR